MIGAMLVVSVRMTFKDKGIARFSGSGQGEDENRSWLCCRSRFAKSCSFYTATDNDI